MNYLFSPEKIKVGKVKNNISGYVNCATCFTSCKAKCEWNCRGGCKWGCRRRCVGSCKRRTLW